MAVTELFRTFARKGRNIALQQEAERSQFRLPPASLAALLCGFGASASVADPWSAPLAMYF